MEPNQGYNQQAAGYNQYNQGHEDYNYGGQHSPNVVFQTIKNAPRLRCTNSLLALTAALLGLVFVGAGLCVFFFIGHDNIAEWPAWALVVGGTLLLVGGTVYFIWDSYCRGPRPQAHGRLGDAYEMGQPRGQHAQRSNVQYQLPAQNVHSAAPPVAPTPQPSMGTVVTDDVPPSYASAVSHSTPPPAQYSHSPYPAASQQQPQQQNAAGGYGFHNTSV